MWGSNPRISAWSSADSMCPPACTYLQSKTTLRGPRVDWPSHINVLRMSRRSGVGTIVASGVLLTMRLLGRDPDVGTSLDTETQGRSGRVDNLEPGSSDQMHMAMIAGGELKRHASRPEPDLAVTDRSEPRTNDRQQQCHAPRKRPVARPHDGTGPVAALADTAKQVKQLRGPQRPVPSQPVRLLARHGKPPGSTSWRTRATSASSLSSWLR